MWNILQLENGRGSGKHLNGCGCHSLFSAAELMYSYLVYSYLQSQRLVFQAIDSVPYYTALPHCMITVVFF